LTFTNGNFQEGGNERVSDRNYRRGLDDILPSFINQMDLNCH